MKTIVLSGIFGRTAAHERLLAELGEDSLILVPYDSEFIGFKNEKSATCLEHESFAFIGASRSYLPHDVLRLCFPSLQSRISQFDATKLRDFMEF